MSLFMSGLLFWALSDSCRAESPEQQQQQKQQLLPTPIETSTHELQTLPLLREALHSAQERKKQRDKRKSAGQKDNLFDKYSMRVCNAYAWSEAIEVHQVRTSEPLAKLEYKRCADIRVEMSSLEHFEFRRPSQMRDVVRDYGLSDFVSSVEDKVMNAFNSSDVTRDGLLAVDEFVRMQEIMNSQQIVEEGYDRKHFKRQFRAADKDHDGLLSIAEIAQYQVFGPLADVGPNLLGTFVVENQVGTLPDPKALETLLLLVVTRSEKPLGTYESARFISHAFGPEELSNVGSNAIISLMDTYKGKVGKSDEVYIHYDEKADGKNFSKFHEQLAYNSVVAVGEGNYKIVAAPDTDRRVAHQFYAHPTINYIVVRVGDKSELAEQVGSILGYPEELLVFPAVDSITEVGQGMAPTWEVIVLTGTALMLIVVALILLCCETGGGLRLRKGKG